jgi:hypothetical protein
MSAKPQFKTGRPRAGDTISYTDMGGELRTGTVWSDAPGRAVWVIRPDREMVRVQVGNARNPGHKEVDSAEWQQYRGRAS